MMKEIGSIFPLSGQTLDGAVIHETSLSKDRIDYSLCREALYDIAINLTVNDKRVLIPAYTCQTVIMPFEEAGWDCMYYGITKELRIDTDDLFSKTKGYKPSLVVVHPYYGMDLNQSEVNCLQSLKESGVRVIIDLTQCLFSKQRLDFVDYYVGSYRKWFAIPDGGFLINHTDQSISQPSSENEEFVQREIDAMFLRDLYFNLGEQRIKDISIRLSKSADYLAESHILPHRMSKVSCSLMAQYDYFENQQRRWANFTYLYDHLKGGTTYQPVCKNITHVTTSPLYFTIYAEQRGALQKQLAQNSIYAPVLWPVEDERVLINDEVRYIYDHILAIPCDQRYDENDMERIVVVINKQIKE